MHIRAPEQTELLLLCPCPADRAKTVGRRWCAEAQAPEQLPREFEQELLLANAESLSLGYRGLNACKGSLCSA